MCTDVGQARPVMCEREIDAADIGVKFPVAIRMLGERKVGERTMDHQLTTRGMPALQAVGEPVAQVLAPVQQHERLQPVDVLHRKIRIQVEHRRGTRLVRQLQIEMRSEEHTSELQSLMRISYAVFCLNKT